MRYSIEPRERRYVKGYGFLSFARYFNDKYSKSLMDVRKTFAKTAGKKILKETEKATGDLIGKERYISPKEGQKIIDELKLA